MAPPSTVSISRAVSGRLDDAAVRLCITKQELADLVAAMALGSLRASVSQEQRALGSVLPAERGAPANAAMMNIGVEARLGERLTEYAKTLRLSRSRLLEAFIEDFLERLDFGLREGWNRHTLPSVVREMVDHLEANPHTSPQRAPRGEE